MHRILLQLFVMCCFAAAQVIRVQLNAPQKYTEIKQLIDEIRYLDVKYEKQITTNRTLLRNVQGMHYTANITVGVPPQKFTILFDTGSRFFWLPSIKCDVTCHSIRHKYNANISQTYVKIGERFDAQFRAGVVVGYYSQETISLGGLQLTEQIFGEAVQIPQTFSDNAFEGIIGLSFRQTDGYDTLLENLCRQKMIKRCIFSLYLSPQTGGEVLFGGIDRNKFMGKLTSARLIKSGYWSFMVQSLSIGGARYITTFAAIADTGSSFILAPEKDFRKINEVIGGKRMQFGYYQLNCENSQTLPSVQIRIANSVFVMHARDYVVRMTTEDGKMECFSGFANAKTAHWVFGEIFLNKFYTVFDVERGRIGFARVTEYN